MTTGNGRIRKTGTSVPTVDDNKELINQHVQDAMEQVGVVGTSVSDNIDSIDMITSNDHDDVFYGPAPKVALTLDSAVPVIGVADELWQEIKQNA